MFRFVLDELIFVCFVELFLFVPNQFRLQSFKLTFQ
jgi:hypothetical protein